ncbi:hypothetical protein PAXRUDRAFT_259041 [Paxillus rubicundulus Ve08.2h10]|uniref:Uncharacterized protein n=1 Tax=Paxillus rubicundulus Ve08.2h10 TaxID=930991 RepID=A0A0D0CAJ7_9AGAM|nr:hypothetical protein PAXRUDRAFT_259041 [Paxillus rubicundulus Ve08.2h10]
MSSSRSYSFFHCIPAVLVPLPSPAYHLPSRCTRHSICSHTPALASSDWTLARIALALSHLYTTCSTLRSDCYFYWYDI